MDRTAIIGRLRQHEAELRAMGLESLSLFGSVARGEAHAKSDVDLAGRLDSAQMIGGFGYAAIADRLRGILNVKVDLLTEPARHPAMQQEVDRDRVHVF